MKQYKDIFKEWHSEFPVLSKYTERTLYMRINPLIIGLRLQKDRFGGDDYLPVLEIIPLWEENPKRFGKPLCWDNLQDMKRLDFTIIYSQHDYYFPEALACVEIQFGKILKEVVFFRDLMEFKNHLIRQFITKHNQCDWIYVFQLQLGLALYFNKRDLLEQIELNIEREIKYWTPKYLHYCDESIDEYREQIYQPFKDREKFMEIIEMNSQRPKVAKLNVGTIVGIDDYHYETKQSWLDRLRSLFTKR